MSTAGAIRAGAAYVEAFLDDNRVTRGLDQLKGKLRAWSATLGGIASATHGGALPEPLGALMHFAQSPAGVFTALSAAAKHTAEGREEMGLLAQRAGLTVERFSALAYAARQANVSNEALAGGLKNLEARMFRAGSAAGGGKRALAMALAGLGIDPKTIGDSADALRAIAERFAKLDAQSRIGLAKQLGITELLPLINQGVEEMDRMTARAAELGLVMKEEDVAAAERFVRTYKDLKDIMGSAVKQIGGALVPTMTELVQWTGRIAAAVRDWLKEHKGLVMGLFAGTGAIVSFGIAARVLSFGLGMAAQAAGVVRGAFTVASYAVHAFGVIMGVVQAIVASAAAPYLLLGAVIVGLGVYIANLMGAFDGLADFLIDFTAETKAAFKAVYDALMKGDIQGAFAVLGAYLELEWLRVCLWLQDRWSQFKDFMFQSMPGLSSFLVDSIATIRRAWAEMCGWMEKKWREFSRSLLTEKTAAVFNRLFYQMDLAGERAEAERVTTLRKQGVKEAEISRRIGHAAKDQRYYDRVLAGGTGNVATVAERDKALHEDMERERSRAAADDQETDARTQAYQGQIERDRQAWQNAIAGGHDARDDAAAEELRKRIARQQEELGRLETQAAETPKRTPKPPPGEEHLNLGGDARPVGTFSGTVAGMLGGGDALAVQRKIAENTAEISENTRRLVEGQEHLGDIDRRNPDMLPVIGGVTA